VEQATGYGPHFDRELPRPPSESIPILVPSHSFGCRLPPLIRIRSRTTCRAENSHERRKKIAKPRGAVRGAEVRIQGRAQTELSTTAFNVDAGLVDVIEQACREIENARNQPDSQWSARPGEGPIQGFWRPPKIVDYKVLELGSGVGVYVDSLKKDNARKVWIPIFRAGR
jgi:hypothetical protein